MVLLPKIKGDCEGDSGDAPRALRGSSYFEHKPQTACKDERHHRGCTGYWRVELAVNVGGKRVRRRANARTKTEA